MLLQIHNIRFHQVYCSHLGTINQLFLFSTDKSAFWTEMMLESCGCSLSTLQVATTLIAMATRILELATNLKMKSPARQLKSS